MLSGNFGVVHRYKLLDGTSKTNVACKTLQTLESEDGQKEFLEEAKTMIELR